MISEENRLLPWRLKGKKELCPQSTEGEGSEGGPGTCGTAPGKDQPPENETSAFPRHRSGTSQGNLGVSQPQRASSSRHSGRAGPAPSHDLRAGSRGGGRWELGCVMGPQVGANDGGQLEWGEWALGDPKGGPLRASPGRRARVSQAFPLPTSSKNRPQWLSVG